MKYPFRVYQTKVERHLFWVAESQSLKGCVGQGDTLEEAVSELCENENIWLETACEFNIPIPPIPVEQLPEYSGKFTVRVSPQVHQQAAELAKKQSISLNQYINDAIVAKNRELLVVGYITPSIQNFISSIRGKLFETTSMSGNSIVKFQGKSNSKFNFKSC
jgi:predicted HicB family RNase H-like nuclease